MNTHNFRQHIEYIKENNMSREEAEEYLNSMVFLKTELGNDFTNINKFVRKIKRK